MCSSDLELKYTEQQRDQLVADLNRLRALVVQEQKLLDKTQKDAQSVNYELNRTKEKVQEAKDELEDIKAQQQTILDQTSAIPQVGGGGSPPAAGSSRRTSMSSVAAMPGMPSVLANLAKPIKLVAQSTMSADPNKLQKAEGYLGELSAKNIWAEMLKDKVIQTQSDKLDLMMSMMLNLTASVDKIEREQTTSVKSLVEKPQSLYPNEVYAVDEIGRAHV